MKIRDSENPPIEPDQDAKAPARANAAWASVTPATVQRTLLFLIYAVIIWGTIWRLFLPFIHNPLDLIGSDTQRHYEEALRPGDDGSFALLDPLGYQIWLSMVLRIIGKNWIVMALYSGLLSAVTPWIWYRWLREVFERKQDALLGYALLTILPTWTNHFCYFLDSTILLPAGGLALWKSWQAVRQAKPGKFRLAALCWGVVSAIKTVALPFVAIVCTWLFCRMFSLWRWQAIPLMATCVAIVVGFYLLTPLKIFCHTGGIMLFPNVVYTKPQYESGAKQLAVEIYHVKNEDGHYVYEFASPSLYFPPFAPFSNWMSPRQGVFRGRIDLWRLSDQLRTPYKCTLADWLKYTAGNIVYFFFGWLAEQMDIRQGPERFGSYIRFLWLPLTIATVALGIAKKRRDVLFVMFALSTLCFMFQQSGIMEARYKKIWDGLAVVTFLSMLVPMRRLDVER